MLINQLNFFNQKIFKGKFVQCWHMFVEGTSIINDLSKHLSSNTLIRDDFLKSIYVRKLCYQSPIFCAFFVCEA
jgi:hypothetical protein